MTGWTAALDELERRLDAAAGLVGATMPTDVTPVEPFLPPPVTGPPTAAEAARAADLLRRGELTVARLEDATDALGDELARPARSPQLPPAASMIDTRV